MVAAAGRLHPQPAAEHVGLCCLLAQPFRGPAQRAAPVEVHLEQPVLRVHEAQGRVRVRGAAGADVGDAPLVPVHHHLRSQAPQVLRRDQVRQRHGGVRARHVAASSTFQNIGKLDGIRFRNRVR